MPNRAASWDRSTTPHAARVSTTPLFNLSPLLSRRAVLIALASLPAAFAQKREPILVAAAADLARTRDPLSESFAKSTGYAARFTFAGTGTLSRQIAQGAPFDVFLSANEEFVKKLTDAGKLRPESVASYANGRLALWSRSRRFRTLEDLAAPGALHIAIANPAHAPYGAAAQNALSHSGLWKKLKAKVVYGENVQQALQFAQTGNADVAITAWSLVFDRGGVLLPADSHQPIRQVGAVVAGTRNPEAAAAFLRFLSGPAGREILRRFGFE